jgi:HEAT repeat protein
MVIPSLVLVWLLAATALLVATALLGLSGAKLYWKRTTLRDAAHRQALRELPLALARGEMPSPAPVEGRRREVALEMMVDTVARLRGRSRLIAEQWFEANGYVADAVREVTSRSDWRRARAVYRLGRFGSAAGEPHLVARLKDRRYVVRDAAVRALGRLGGRGSIGPLLDAFERHRVARGLVSGALLELPSSCDRPLAAEMADRNGESARLIAHVLGMRGRPAGDALLAGLRDREPGVRRESALALARLGDAPPGAELELRRLARDPEPWVRASAATALGTLLGDRAAATLRELAEDEDFWAGYRAAEALVGLPSGADYSWALLMDARCSPASLRARRRCLEVMERQGIVEDRIRASIARGGADLDHLLRALERSGSRAWAVDPR